MNLIGTTEFMWKMNKILMLAIFNLSSGERLVFCCQQYTVGGGGGEMQSKLNV